MHSAAGSSDVAEFMCRVCKVVARVLRKWGEELRFVVLSEVGRERGGGFVAVAGKWEVEFSGSRAGGLGDSVAT